MSSLLFSRPDLSDLEERYLLEALHSEKLAGDHRFTKRAAGLLSAQLEGARVLMTPSCTAALELALLALDVGPKDEVICPSFTFVSTANAAVLRGARVVFAEIERETLNIDPEDVARRITPKTKAILPIHYAGVAADMEALLAVAATCGAAVIEDAAQAFGSLLDDRPAGVLGRAACFSFHETKNLTCGEGGAFVTKDQALAKKAEWIREKGTNRSAFLRGEVDKYTWVSAGSSYLPSELQMAVLVAQLERAEEIARAREARWLQYHAHLEALEERGALRRPRVPPRARANHHIYYVLLPTLEERERVRRALTAQSIPVSFHYVPLHGSPYAKNQLGWSEPLPITEDLAGRLLRLPLHAKLSEEDVSRIAAALEETLS